MHLSGAGDERDHAGAEDGPQSFKSLTSSDQSYAPTDKDRRAKVNQPAGLEIRILDAVHWPEIAGKRRVCLRQKNVPAAPQDEQRHRPRDCEKSDRSEAKHCPWCSDGQGLELPTFDHCGGELIDAAEPTEGSRF